MGSIFQKPKRVQKRIHSMQLETSLRLWTRAKSCAELHEVLKNVLENVATVKTRRSKCVLQKFIDALLKSNIGDSWTALMVVDYLCVLWRFMRVCDKDRVEGMVQVAGDILLTRQWAASNHHVFIMCCSLLACAPDTLDADHATAAKAARVIDQLHAVIDSWGTCLTRAYVYSLRHCFQHGLTISFLNSQPMIRTVVNTLSSTDVPCDTVVFQKILDLLLQDVGCMSHLECVASALCTRHHVWLTTSHLRKMVMAVDRFAMFQCSCYRGAVANLIRCLMLVLGRHMTVWSMQDATDTLPVIMGWLNPRHSFEPVMPYVRQVRTGVRVYVFLERSGDNINFSCVFCTGSGVQKGGHGRVWSLAGVS